MRGVQDVLRSADVDGANRFARSLNRKRRRRVHDHVRSGDERTHSVRVANVTAQLFDGLLELGVVQRNDVEGAHLVALGSFRVGVSKLLVQRAARQQEPGAMQESSPPG